MVHRVLSVNLSNLYLSELERLTQAAAGLQSGYSQIDGFRAAKQSGNITGLGPDPIITMYGYSGGGVTAAWVCYATR